jgi:uncharacterized protein YjbI with pentapeptide repeats
MSQEAKSHDAVKQILDAHRSYRESDGKRGGPANFSGEVIDGYDFSGLDLQGLHAQDTVLTGCKFVGCDLFGADLTDAAAKGCDFSRAQLGKADLQGGDFSASRFDGARLIAAHLSEANLREASFAGADLNGAFLARCDIDGARFDGANLSHTTFAGSRGKASFAHLAGGTAPVLGGQLRLVEQDGPRELFIEPGERVLVGRGPDADVRIDFTRVGRRQAYLSFKAGRWLIEDAGSPSGTYVNRRSIHGPTLLEVNDRIDLSGITFVVAEIMGE